MKVGSFPALAHGKALYVGDPVAVVIAETYAQARDAAEKIVVEYGVLPAVVDTASAAKPGQPQIHDFAPNNTVFNWHLGDKAATDAAFRQCGACDKARSRQQPHRFPTPWSREQRWANTIEGADVTTLYTTSQNPHVARVVLSAFQGVAPENKLRVIAPDVGGGFGSKIFIYNEETVCAWAAKKIDRPVKWTAERTESFLTDAHGRDHVTHAELALDASGKILGFARPHHRKPRRLSFDLLVGRADVAVRDRSCRVSTTSRRSTWRLTGSIRTQCRSTRCAARAGPRRHSWSSASSKWRRARPDAIRPISAARTSSSHFPHQTPVVICLRRRRLCQGARQGAGACGLQRRSRAQGGVRRQGQAAWRRIFRLYRGMRPCALRRRRARLASASGNGNRLRCA